MESKSKEKIGIGIITYNSENYFKTLYDSLPLNKIDELIVVNGGNKYENDYKCNWIQHNFNYYPAVCRNDAINFLLNRNCDHIFLIEDDMIIKRPDIFEAYIKASNISGLKYLCFTSMSWGSGSIGARTPRITINYKNNVSIAFYANMCNEFTYHHRSCFEKVGLYDTQFRDPFDIDMAYRESKQDYSSLFWYFADIADSDLYIENNSNAVSRLQSDRPDGSREKRIQEQLELFFKKHQIYISEIPYPSEYDLIEKLKLIKP
jgi:hypothetical protein